MERSTRTMEVVTPARHWTLGETVARRAQYLIVTLLVGVIGSGCGAMAMKQNKQTASVVDFLYRAEQPPARVPKASIAELRIPLRVGIAFVPGVADPKFGISEVEQLAWSTQVKGAFEKYPFVGELSVVPPGYLKSGGGFENLQQISALFNLDVIALLSYDQIQFSEPNSLSATYWTIIGAYVIPGDKYDIHTMLEATVFDIRSRKLLFRAPGTSTVKGSSAWVGFSGRSRQARAEGFNGALQQLIPNLDAALQEFRKRAQSDVAIRLDLPPGYDPNALRPAVQKPAAR